MNHANRAPDPRRPCRPRLVVALLVLVLAPGPWSSGSAGAAPAGTSSMPPRNGTFPEDRSSRGTAANPIPLAGTEISATGLAARRSRDRVELRVGSVTTSLYGVRHPVLPIRGGIDPDTGDAWMSDVYAGGEWEVAIGGSACLCLEGGRVTLRDPVSVLEWGGASGEYWTTSAGLAIRF